MNIEQIKYALVTGGSGGIGSAICVRLSQIGFHVIIHYNANISKANATLETIIDNGGTGDLIQFDVSDSSAVTNAIDIWKKEHPEDYISVLVNNAGLSKDLLMVWMENDDWKSVIDTNLNSFFYVTSGLVKEMVLRKWGRIINIVSLSGLKGLPGQTNYSAAKAGVIGATKALAQEIGRKKVTVNAVAPGYIRTEMTKDLDEKQLRKLIPANRFGTPEEVADLVAFLAGDGASYITGEVISINGGLYT